MSAHRILLTGAQGQIGAVLASALRRQHGPDRVVCSDISAPGRDDGMHATLDVLDAARLREVVRHYRIGTVYHLAAVLSARGEGDPARTWDVNVRGLLNVLDAAREGLIRHVFFPSTIAVFGPNVPLDDTPDDAVLNPTTVYGMSKAAGENWCAYYHARWNVDVRSLRYPGVVGHQSLPGGGTTDYAIDIFRRALASRRYECFLRADQRLPMIYMDDAIRATLELMGAPADRIRRRTGYNIRGLSFTPAEIAAEIAHRIGEFQVAYAPDFRQDIAASWPRSLDDKAAREDWGWSPSFDLPALVQDMLSHLSGGPAQAAA
jgi:nucleoside-diphosphate-sugar epimerase